MQSYVGGRAPEDEDELENDGYSISIGNLINTHSDGVHVAEHAKNPNPSGGSKSSSSVSFQDGGLGQVEVAGAAHA